MDPLYAATLQEKAKINGYIRPQLTADSFFMGNEEIEEPTIRYLAHTLAAQIGKKPLKIHSWAGSEFYIDAFPEEIQKLIGQKGVSGISEVDVENYEAHLVFSQAVGDIYSGSEIIPWWKIYTNTNDTLTSSNMIITVDGPIVSPISTDLSFGTIDNSWDTSSWVSNPYYWGFWHAAHVAGVIGAKNNNFLLRGINPDQPIRHYGGGPIYSSVADRFNLITAYTELSYRWSVVNLSMNTSSPLAASTNPFEYEKDLGRKMSIASNSNLVVQAAGNANDDACLYGYTRNGAALPYDGVMLIGGHDIDGQRSTSDTVIFNNGAGSGVVPGSNNGACVELWAPSKQITSLRYNTNLTQVLSGTSFSAPITAAIATRYGDSTTRPIEREYFLRYYAGNTGYTDGTGRAIQSVKWNTGTSSIIKRYPISSFWSPQNVTDIAILKDGVYQGLWNAMGNVGTVVIDLGQVRTVQKLRITLRSSVVTSADGQYPVYFSVAATGSGTSTTATSAYQNDSMPKHYDRTPHTINLATPITSRYLILNGHNYGSWLAYSEIEAYGP